VILEIRGVRKSFGGTHALRGVDFSVAAGEIVGLVGGNGAGKSTLMKIAAGVHRPDAGTVQVAGRTLRSPAEAIALGVSLVRQELTLVDDLDVGSNILLGHEPHRFFLVDQGELYGRAARALERVGGGIDPRAPLSSLSPAQKQKVEIARALSLDASVLLLDEPTAALAEADAERLFGLLRELQAQGLGLVYISHRLREVLEITDRVVCLRDGEKVAEVLTRVATHEILVELLAGRAAERAAAPLPRDEVALSVRGPVDFDLRRGEILGLAGLVGAGRTEALRRLFGADPGPLEVRVEGRPVEIRSPEDAIRAGLALVPEERATQGLLLDHTIERNIALPSLRRWVVEDEAAIARPLIERLGIQGRGLAANLSGGNQQKVVLAKWLARNPKVLLLDEPTRGLDIRAKAEVHAIVRELAAAGKGIVVASSEVEEIGALCHRALVMAGGRVRGELLGEALTEANILRLAT
jgi:ribose transport system ATP-binding protein